MVALVIDTADVHVVVRSVAVSAAVVDQQRQRAVTLAARASPSQGYWCAKRTRTTSSHVMYIY